MHFIVECIEPNAPGNGSVFVDQPTITYSCDKGFTMSGSSTGFCNTDGTSWSIDTPTCGKNRSRHYSWDFTKCLISIHYEMNTFELKCCTLHSVQTPNIRFTNKDPLTEIFDSINGSLSDTYHSPLHKVDEILFSFYTYLFVAKQFIQCWTR